MSRLNSEKFHNSSFEPKLVIFEGKSGFLRIHPTYEFSDSDNGYFREEFKNHI